MSPPFVRWPADPPFRITQHYGENPNHAEYGYGPEGHPGVDLVVETPPYAVLSPLRGWTKRQVSSGGYGLSVTVESAEDPELVARVAHLSGFVVLPNTLVEPGEVLGYMGATGHTFGAHVHFELRYRGEPLDPATYIREREQEGRAMAWKGGWHLGNKGPMTETDWAILRACPPSCVTFLTGEQITSDDLQRIREISPDCQFIARPYYSPQPYSHTGVLSYMDKCIRDLEAVLQVVPPHRLWLKPFNEPNQPRGHANWEGFGADEEGMRQYSEAFLTVASGVRNRLGDILGIGFGSLAPGNRDLYFAGDPTNAHYYYHGPQAARGNPSARDIADARQSCLCRDAIAASDALFWHTYLHESLAAWQQPWLGKRHQAVARLYPDKAIYIVEAGFPRRDLFPAWGGEALVPWMHALHADEAVAGVTLWILGDAPDWGSMWYAGSQPRSEVYALQALREGLIEGLPPQGTVTIGPADAAALWARADQEMIPQNPQALLYTVGRARGWEPVSREYDEGPRRYQVWYEPISRTKHLLVHPLDGGSPQATEWRAGRVQVLSRAN